MFSPDRPASRSPSPPKRGSQHAQSQGQLWLARAVPTAHAASEIGHSQPVPKERPGLVTTDQLTKKTKGQHFTQTRNKRGKIAFQEAPAPWHPQLYLVTDSAVLSNGILRRAIKAFVKALQEGYRCPCKELISLPKLWLPQSQCLGCKAL